MGRRRGGLMHGLPSTTLTPPPHFRRSWRCWRVWDSPPCCRAPPTWPLCLLPYQPQIDTGMGDAQCVSGFMGLESKWLPAPGHPRCTRKEALWPGLALASRRCMCCAMLAAPMQGATTSANLHLYCLIPVQSHPRWARCGSWATCSWGPTTPVTFIFVCRVWVRLRVSAQSLKAWVAILPASHPYCFAFQLPCDLFTWLDGI